MRRGTLAAILSVPLLAAACARARVPLSVHETKTFPAAPGKLVRLDLRSLDVDVTVGTAATITAQVDIEAHSSSRTAAQRWMESHTPVFEDSASTLDVRQQPARSSIVIFGYINTNGRVRMALPASVRLEIRTTSGDVTVAGDAALSGPVRIRTSSGSVTVTGGLDELIVKATSGDVMVRRRALTALDADTTSGDVTLESGTQRAIIGTTSGDVRLEQLQGGLSVDTSSGEVAASWAALAAGASIRVHTSSGDVRLRVPASSPLRGHITTRSGSIRSDLPGNSEHRERELTLSAPGPAAEVEIRTSSGDVSVHEHP